MIVRPSHGGIGRDGIMRPCRLYPASILCKFMAGRYRSVRVTDGPITAHYKFIKNAYWVGTSKQFIFIFKGNRYDFRRDNSVKCFASLLKRGLL